jgi:hypothetical protein
MSETKNKMRSTCGIYFVRHGRSCEEQFEIIFSFRVLFMWNLMNWCFLSAIKAVGYLMVHCSGCSIYSFDFLTQNRNYGHTGAAISSWNLSTTRCQNEWDYKQNVWYFLTKIHTSTMPYISWWLIPLSMYGSFSYRNVYDVRRITWSIVMNISKCHAVKVILFFIGYKKNFSNKNWEKVQIECVRMRDLAWNRKNLWLRVTVLSHSAVKLMNNFPRNRTKKWSSKFLGELCMT